MKTSKQFYNELTAEGLSKRKKDIHTKKELKYIKRLINKKDKILDLGCGYGRFTIPLAKEGYNIEGIDITPLMVKKAKENAKKNRVRINFQIGDMRQLHYGENKFNKILCMWSAFLELTKEKDQVKTIKEVHRVLTPKGFALFEMSKPFKVDKKGFIDEKTGDKYFQRGRILLGKIEDIEKMPSYIHDKKTLLNLMKKTKIKKYKIFITKFGGRERLFLQFWKNEKRRN